MKCRKLEKGSFVSKMENNISIAGAASLIAEKKKILIITHIRPDGDTIGSAFGLKYALEGYADVRVICAQKLPNRLAFIADGETVLFEARLGEFRPEMVICVDAAELELMDEYGNKYASAIDLKLDHHPLGSHYARYNYIDGKAAATAEIIYEVVRELELIGAAKLTKKAASALYAALSSDSGCFKYGNVTSKTMHIGAELMDAGAEAASINEKMFESKGADEVIALKLALNGMNIYRQGTVVAFTITEQMRNTYGITDDAFGEIVSFLRSIEGVELALTIRQLSDDLEKYRVSMRSRSNIDACKLCTLIGGGGHARAAGGWISAASPEEAERKLMNIVLAEIL